jgi:hypothetical protein
MGDEAGITLIHHLKGLSLKNSPRPFSASEFKPITSSVPAHYFGTQRDLHIAVDRNHPIMFAQVVIVWQDNPVHM